MSYTWGPYLSLCGTVQEHEDYSPQHFDRYINPVPIMGGGITPTKAFPAKHFDILTPLHTYYTQCNSGAPVVQFT